MWYGNGCAGEPQRRKVISRKASYHGSTNATSALGGSQDLRGSFGIPMGFSLQVSHPSWPNAGLPGEDEEGFTDRLAEELEQPIIEAGPETIGAMIAEWDASGRLASGVVRTRPINTCLTLNSRLNFRRCIGHLQFHQTPQLGVHGTGNRPYLDRDSKRLTTCCQPKDVPLIHRHTSGHADLAMLRRFAKALAPEHIVPIHTAIPHLYFQYFEKPRVLKMAS